MMKKIFKAILAIVIIIPSFIYPPYEVSALTLRELYSNLSKLEGEAQLSQSKIDENSRKINQTRAEINTIANNIQKTEEEITKQIREIERLNDEILKKDKETKELVRYLQVASGDMAYLDYIFGAVDMTDFIYRVSTVEQLSKYNDELIDTMNTLIGKSETTKEKLKETGAVLQKQQAELSVKLADLSSVQSDLYELSRDIKDEIKNAKAVIAVYDKACKGKLDVDITSCNALPPDTKFWRPMIKGYVTSEYGWRTDPITGSYISFHNALDLSNYDRYNTVLYSTAAGKVAKVFWDSAGGNQVVIHHYVNGSYYSSTYAHLSTTYVKDNQTVTKDTPIGIMGTTGSSTGEHVHFAISTGRRYIDYVDYNTYSARTVNPRTMVNFPSGRYNAWANRTTKY